MALPAILIGLLPTVIDMLKPVVAAKVKAVVQDKDTGTVSVVQKPWWQSKAMLGAVLLLASIGGRFFGYELTGTQIDQTVEILLGLFIMFGRAKAVR